MSLQTEAQAFIAQTMLQQREIWWFCVGCEAGENEDTAFHDLDVPLDDDGPERARVMQAFTHSPDCPAICISNAR